MLEDVENTRGALGWIDSYPEASMLGINDDMKEGEEDVYRQVLDPCSRTPLAELERPVVRREQKAGSGEIDEVNGGS